MLGLTDMRETRVYQEGREEGREEEARSLISRLLTRKLGDVPAIPLEHLLSFDLTA